MVGKHCWLSNHFVYLSCLHVVSMTGVVHSLLVLSGKLRLSETKTNLFELWRAWASYLKSSYANCVMQQCLACAYMNRTQSAMCPECSVRLICHISVSALLLIIMNYRKIGCKSTLFHPIHQTFSKLFFEAQMLIHKVYKNYTASLELS